MCLIMRDFPRYFGIRIGLSAKEVYEKWEQLGLIEDRDNHTSGWEITDFGESLGGKYSSQGTPTFDYENIKHLL